MRAVLVVVVNILREETFQVAFVNCNDVIQENVDAAEALANRVGHGRATFGSGYIRRYE